MPIKPENKNRYPKNWSSEIRPAILDRANHCCEGCGASNYSLRNGKKIILTIAHLDHTPENCDSTGFCVKDPVLQGGEDVKKNLA